MKTILIVDDEQDLTETLKVVLEAEGYRVLIAGDGKACLTIVHEQKPDLVLLDIMIPYVNGYEVLKTMKSDSKYSSIPVVMMSASRPNVSRSEYKWHAFLAKPFDLFTLLGSIRELFEKGKFAA